MSCSEQNSPEQSAPAPISSCWARWGQWLLAPRLLLSTSLSLAPLLSLLSMASCEAPEPMSESSGVEEQKRETMTRRDTFALAERGPLDRSLSDQQLPDQQRLDQAQLPLLRERGILDASQQEEDQSQRDARPIDQALRCEWGQEGSVIFSERVELEAPFDRPLALRWAVGQLFLLGFSGDDRETTLRVGILNAPQEEPRALRFRLLEALPFTSDPFEANRNALSPSSELPFLLLHSGQRGLELIEYQPFEREQEDIFERERLLDADARFGLQLAAAGEQGEPAGLFAYTENPSIQGRRALQIASLRRPQRDTSFFVSSGENTALYWHPTAQLGLFTYQSDGASGIQLVLLDALGSRIQERGLIVQPGASPPRVSSHVLPVEDGFLIAVTGQDRIVLSHIDFNGRQLTERAMIPIRPQPETLSGLKLFSLNGERLILFWHREGRQLSAVPLTLEGRLEQTPALLVDLPPTPGQRLTLAHDGSQRFFLIQQRFDNTLTVGGFSFACF